MIGSPIVCFTDHLALKYLLSKKDTKPRLIRWILLLQEFNLIIKDNKGVENVVADHLSRLTFKDNTINPIPIQDSFPDEQLYFVSSLPWYADIVNYLVTGKIPSQWSSPDKKRFLAIARHFYFDDPYLFKYCADQVIRKCVPNEEIENILFMCHSSFCGRHFSSRVTAMKILQRGLYWPTLFKDSYSYCKACNRYQMLGSLTKRNQMPLAHIITIEIFDCLDS